MRYAPTELADHTCVIIILNSQFSILNWNQFSIGINSQLESILLCPRFPIVLVSSLTVSNRGCEKIPYIIL
jgi:hypothetical protein